MTVLKAKKQRAALVAAPAYQRIEADLRARIDAGGWQTGAMFSSRRELAQEYRVDLTTIQRAIAPMLADGTLRATGGRGTYVARAPRTTMLADAVRGASSEAPGQAHAASLQTLGIVGTIYPSRNIRWGDGAVWPQTIVEGVERGFCREGRTTTFFNRYMTEYDFHPVGEGIAACLAAGADALVVVGIHDGPEIADAILSAVDIDRVPTILVAGHEMIQPVPHVFYDNRYGGYQAARHLIQQGHDDMVFFSPFPASWGEARLSGAREAVRQAGLPASALAVFPPDPHGATFTRQDEIGYAAAQEMLRDRPMPTAIIAVNDQVAFGFIRAAQERGQMPGVHYAILGFDDEAASRQIGLTSLHPPLQALAAEAVRLLLSSPQESDMSVQTRLKSHLIPRASTRPLRSSLSLAP